MNQVLAAVSFQQIRKSFGPVDVLRGISFDIPFGTIVGLLGENGAGKSTLMKILSGYEVPSSGSLLVQGQAVHFKGPKDAEAQGIAMVHQEFALAEDLSITQNIFLGHERRRGLWLDEAWMRAEALKALQAVGLNRHPDTPVRQLIVAEKQLVEIAKALQRQARVLVMDEPTATLTPAETKRLFALMAQLKAQGTSIVYISHKLDEVEAITDEVVVMRDGLFVARAQTSQTNRKQMASLMVGRELKDLYPEKVRSDSALPLLSVRDLCVPGWAQGISFDVHAGEILGFAGLVGSGRTEMFEGLLGLRPAQYSKLEFKGRPLAIRNPRDAVAAGLTYLSEDRKGKGLHLNFGLRENLTLMALERYTSTLLDRAAEQAALQRDVQTYGIQSRSMAVNASALSGGNQQKLALAKILQPDPRVVILDEPTRGVDVGAKREIYVLIQQLARSGRAVIVISSELMELIGVCHRITVIRGGQQQATVDADGATEEALISHATGTH